MSFLRPVRGSMLLISLLGFALRGSAADPVPAQKTPTLAEALMKAEPPHEELYLTVGAEKVKLPEKAAPPADGESVPVVAAAYGRTVQYFGNVDAVAPATITVLRSPRGAPNPYDGMPPGTVMKLLTGMFTAAQWKAFLSDSGVGYGDLMDDRQKRLFEALFPDGHMVVARFDGTDPFAPGRQKEIPGSDLKSARLRLVYSPMLALTVTGKPREHIFANIYSPPSAPIRFIMMNAAADDVDREYGSTVREKIPNALKAGDLDRDDPAWKKDVAIDGAHTVDDLVTRIGAAAQREVYADPRYGTRSVTFVGPSKSVRALDLMNALALCLAGTFRHVGAAWVLTDDLIGLGTRHALWKEFEEKAKAMMPGESSVSDLHLPADAPYTLEDLSSHLNPLGFTPQQYKDFWKQWRADGGMSGSGMISLTLPFDQLSPAQQDAARHIQANNAKEHIDTDVNGTVLIQEEPIVEVTLASLDAPVMIFGMRDSLLPYPALTAAEQATAAKAREAAIPWLNPANRERSDLSIRAAAQPFARRAVRIAPLSADAAVRGIAAIKDLGFNEVWLAITPAKDEARDVDAVSLLREAVKTAAPLGVSVYPDLSLLAWAKDASDAQKDRDIAGRASDQASEPEGVDMVGKVLVSPFDPQVARRMQSLVRELAGAPGIAGMVWHDLVSPGYVPLVPDQGDNVWGNPLGFTVAGRLASLRKSHVDPVDLYTNYHTDTRAHANVPGFDDDFNLDRSLYDGWRKLRADTIQSFTASLAAELPYAFAEGDDRLPLITPPLDQAFANVLGSWDDFHLPIANEQFTPVASPGGKEVMGAPLIETMPGRLSYSRLQAFLFRNQGAGGEADAIATALASGRKTGQQNVLLDITGFPGLLEEVATVERKRAAKPAGK